MPELVSLWTPGEALRAVSAFRTAGFWSVTGKRILHLRHGRKAKLTVHLDLQESSSQDAIEVDLSQQDAPGGPVHTAAL